MSQLIVKYYKGDSNSFDSLKEKYLWFSKPPYFNDPFDCSIEHLISRDSQLSDEGKKFIRENTKEFGICCFSEDPLSHHMWSFYADGHKGYCIEYDRDVIRSFCSEKFQANCELMPCIYDEYPINLDDRIPWERDGNYIKEVPLSWILECPKKTDRLFQMLLLQKNAQIWKNEKEWRIIIGGRAIRNGAKDYVHKEKGYKIPFPENAIKSIIFGSKMVEAGRKRIEHINQEVYSGKLELKEIELNNSTWELKLKQAYE